MPHRTLLFLTLLAFTSCKSGNKQPLLNDQVNQTIVVMLVDYSQSTQSPDIRNHYMNTVKKVVSQLGERDVFYAAMITDRSVTEHKLICESVLPGFTSSTDNDLYLAAEKQKFTEKLSAMRDSIAAVMNATIASSPRNIPSTDILSSLQLAEKLFLQHPASVKKLVILSDMMEESSNYNFTTPTNGEAYFSEVLQSESRNHHFPDLSKVQVYVAGADAASSGRFEMVQHFWLRYFDSCGAVCPEQNYASLLMNY